MIEGLMGAGAGLSLLGMGMNMAGEYQGNRAVGRAIGANYERKNAIRQQRQALVGNRVAELQASNPGAMMSGLATKWTGDQAQAYNAGAQPFLEQGYGVSEFDPNSAWLKNFAAAQQAENGASAASNNRNANEFRELQIQSDVADQAAQRDMMVAGRKGQGLRTVGALAQGLGGLGLTAGMAFGGEGGAAAGGAGGAAQTASAGMDTLSSLTPMDAIAPMESMVPALPAITEQNLNSINRNEINEINEIDPSMRGQYVPRNDDGSYNGLSVPVEPNSDPNQFYKPYYRPMQVRPNKYGRSN